ncbi:MAG: hypothetical protein AMXMBFR64_34950 [Myxococcales bacterium]
MTNKNDKYGFTEGTMVDIDGEHVGGPGRKEPSPRPLGGRDASAPPASRAPRPAPPPAPEPVDLESTRAMEMAPQGDAERTVLMESPVVDRPKAYLTIVGGQDKGKEVPLRAAEVLVGRGLDCDLVLNDPSVSRKHFKLVLAGDKYKLVDLGSGNGTTINGQRVKELVLAEGTELKSGTTVMRIGYGAVAPAPKDQTSTAHVPRPQPPQRKAPPVEEIEEAEPVRGGAGKAIAIAAVVILVLGGATWFVGEKLMGWWNLAGLAPTTVTPASTASADEADDEAEEASEAATTEAEKALAEAEKALEGLEAGGDAAAAIAAAQKAALEAAGGDAAAAIAAAQKAAEAAGGDAAAAIAAAQKAALEAAGGDTAAAIAAAQAAAQAAGGDAAAAIAAAQKAAEAAGGDAAAAIAAAQAAAQAAGGDAAAALAAAQKAAEAAGGDAAAAMAAAAAAQKAALEAAGGDAAAAIAAAQKAALEAAGQTGDASAAMADAMKAAAEAQKAALAAAGQGGDAAAAIAAAQQAAMEAQKAALAAAGQAQGDAADAIAKANAAALAAAQGGDAALKGAEQVAGGAQVAAVVPPTAADDDVKALFEGGLELTKDQRWDDALAKFEAVKAKSASYPGLSGAMARVQAERGMGAKLEDAKRKLAEGQTSKGLEILKAIPETSSYFVDAATLLAEARDDFVRDRMTDARTAVRNKNAGEARKAVKAVLAENADHADARALSKALDQGMPAAYKLVTGETLEDKPKVDKPKPSKADFGSAISAYKAGRFDDAISQLEAESRKDLPKADQARAKDYIKNIKKFRNNYGEGKAAAKGFQAAAATGPLEKAWQADQKLGGHYSGELKRMLADMNAYRAASYFAKNEYGTAAVFARKALSFDSSQQSASQVYSKSQEKAESLHQQGMSAWNGGNKALAGSFFRQVIKILPDTHPSYKEAYSLLGQMEE